MPKSDGPARSTASRWTRTIDGWRLRFQSRCQDVPRSTCPPASMYRDSQWGFRLWAATTRRWIAFNWRMPTTVRPDGFARDLPLWRCRNSDRREAGCPRSRLTPMRRDVQIHHDGVEHRAAETGDRHRIVAGERFLVGPDLQLHRLSRRD